MISGRGRLARMNYDINEKDWAEFLGCRLILVLLWGEPGRPSILAPNHVNLSLPTRENLFLKHLTLRNLVSKQKVFEYLG